MTLAWPAVFHENRAFVHAMARRLAGPDMDHDDITQEVFVVVHRKLGGLRDAEQLRSWLYSICRRVAAHQRRKARRRASLRELLGQRPAPPPPTPEHLRGQGELERRLYAALDRLTDKRREVLILFALESMGGNDIARLLDIPVATVWTRLHAARKELLERLQEGGASSAELQELVSWNN